MIKEGLICKPEFDDKNKYLQFGNRTNCNKKIIEIANSINEPTDGLTVRKILLWYRRKNQVKKKNLLVKKATSGLK